MTLSNKDEFIEWLKLTPFNENYFECTSYNVSEEILEIEEIHLKGFDLEGKNLLSTRFINCVFEDCNFNHTIFYSSALESCAFIDCVFTSSKFLDSDLTKCVFNKCKIVDFELADVRSSQTSFVECSEIIDFIIGTGHGRNYKFSNCYIGYLTIRAKNRKYADRFVFDDCLIDKSNFYRVDFRKSSFNRCVFSSNQFANSILSSTTLENQNVITGSEFNHIDLRSLIDSDNLSDLILENLFGIHNPEIKEYLFGLTTKIEFQSIFISYSFRDNYFAKKINDALIRRGILTFLWEKDAPGGKPLEEIMQQGIKGKDKILFIASENSLKSKACHFELTQGRKKQEQTWENVLVPIHIDNFLFEVAKEQIRPRESQDEYWKNIEELKMMHSINFTPFNSPGGNEEREFESCLYKLLRGLRKA